RKVGLVLRNRLSIHASRSLVGLHTFEGFPDFPFRDLERLCLVHGLLPFPVGQWPRPNNAAPSLQPHYRAFHATTGCSAPALRIGTLALAVGAACGFSLHAISVTEHRFSRSVRKPGRVSTLLEMTSARSGLKIEFKLDGQSPIFAWTKRTSSVKWAVSALPSGAHPANLRRKLMRKVSLTLAIALPFAGSAALTADAQTSCGANDIAGAAHNFTPLEPPPSPRSQP